jgi:hypothetical protein
VESKGLLTVNTEERAQHCPPAAAALPPRAHELQYQRVGEPACACQVDSFGGRSEEAARDSFAADLAESNAPSPSSVTAVIVTERDFELGNRHRLVSTSQLGVHALRLDDRARSHHATADRLGLSRCGPPAIASRSAQASAAGAVNKASWSASISTSTTFRPSARAGCASSQRPLDEPDTRARGLRSRLAQIERW